LPHLERALVLRQTQFAASPRLAEAQIMLANCKIALGDSAGARALLVEAKTIHAANAELGLHYRKPLADLSARLGSI
jgi:thioredoxin-like negative regulator of GroEL